jgi:hypothetical protein
MTIGIFKEWLVKYFFVHKIVLKAILVFWYNLDFLETFAVSKMASYVFILLFYLDVVWFVDGQNHEILKPAISGFYIRFHPIYRPCFYFIRKHMTPFLDKKRKKWRELLPDQ